jgi:putative endopeptidase
MNNNQYKCPCCNNPWAAATGELFAKMCEECVETQKQQQQQPEGKDEEEDKSLKMASTEGTTIDNIDFGVDASVSPCEDFFLFANKKWMDTNPIPAGYPSWNTFLHLHVLSQERLKDLLQDLLNSGTDSDGVENSNKDTQKLAYFYKAAMDEERIEADRIEPLVPLLDSCKKAVAAKSNNDKAALAKALGELLHDFGVTSFFSIGVSPDNKNSNHSICQVSQGGLGLPDRDYYFDQDKEDKRNAYKLHIAKMLSLVHGNHPTLKDDDVPNDEFLNQANQIYELEEKIANDHMTKTENRDPEATYNKMSIDDFVSNVCHDHFDFHSFIKAATGKSSEELGDINVRNLKALTAVSEIIDTMDPELLGQYLVWRSIRSCAKYMPRAFVMEDFEFNEKTLAGTQDIKPRWQRAMAFTEAALGEALGQIYCARYFDESCKEKVLSIVESVRKALEERLKEVDWIKSDLTRQQALKKMSRFSVKIGYPDEWIDYSTLDIEKDEPFLSMIFKSRKFDLLREVKEMNAPTDKKKWFMTPQTINAYYHPSLNEIVFPAAILQPPMFDANADIAVNFGAIGAVVGHEMTHGFDDKGRKFNYEGNMVDWWNTEDAEEYERRVQVMVDQADSVVIHGQNLKGKLTCGENIADLGGLRLALRALKSHPDYNPNEVIGGFTPIQRFFLGWAKCWRQNITKERALQLLTLDPHGPNPIRCNGPLSNMPEFHDAFNVDENSPMYKAEHLRVNIW